MINTFVERPHYAWGLVRILHVTGWLLVSSGLTGMGFAHTVVEVENGATITGRVTFGGTPAPTKHFEVKNEPEVCGTERRLPGIIVNQGLLQDAVIALEGIQTGKAFSSYQDTDEGEGRGTFQYAGGTRLHLDIQVKRCSFGPFTGVIMVDDAVQFTNNDSNKHTLHTYLLKQGGGARILKTLHTQSLRPGGLKEKAFLAKKLRRAVAVAVTCDRHEFMRNWLYIIKNPYYAVSDESGNFRIDQIPPGDYDLVVWHPLLEMKKQRVTLSPNDSLSIDFALTK